jgi:hypothetical protein
MRWLPRRRERYGLSFDFNQRYKRDYTLCANVMQSPFDAHRARGYNRGKIIPDSQDLTGFQNL